MRRIIYLITFILAFSSCDDEEKPETSQKVAATSIDSIQNYKGNFITAGDAAVLKGSKFIFQVKMDSLAIALKDSLEAYKNHTDNLIPIEIKGKVIKNPSSVGYSQIIEIKDIVEVFAQRPKETN